MAFLGDSVFELLVRERLVSAGSMPVGKLHMLAVKQVKASAQAKAFEGLSNILSEDEKSILLRGRNANSATPPKSCDIAEYRKATGIEALFGYLYLKGETERINYLYDYIVKIIQAE